MSECRTQCVVELNECWSYWLDQLYPGMHPQLAMKGIIIDRLHEFANKSNMLIDAHVGFFDRPKL